jgi:hypothetical protein
MKFKQLLFALALFPFSFFSACKSSAKITDAPKPPEQYGQELDLPIISNLTIPVNISVDEIVRSLNTKLSGGALFEDYSYTDNNNDGLMMNAWKSSDITLSFNGNSIKYRLPLKLWMKKQLVLGAEAEAEAELALSFKTVFSLQPDWSIKTQTEVEYHEWLSKPILKTGLGNISVETIGNLVLNRSKKTLAQTLDQYVSQQISLKPYVQEAWTALQEPVLLDTAYQMWVKTTPVGIGMTPLTTYGNALQARIAVECINDVTFGSKPTFRENANVPPLRSLEHAPDEFQVRISTDVPFPEAERLARTMMLGQVFESGKNKVYVEDIHLWGNNDKVVVNTKLKGSFNGNIYFIGRPEFNPQKNQIEIKDLDFHVDTRNFLMRSASWLFQGAIKKQMAQSMVFPMAENINALKQSIQGTLDHYEIQQGVVLRGTIDDVTVEKTYLTSSSIRVNLFSRGRVNVELSGL